VHRLAAGQRYHFAAADRVVLSASDPPGPARLLVLVAAQARDVSARAPKKLDSMKLFPTGSDAAAIAAGPAGPRALLAGRPVCPAAGACDSDCGAAVLAFDVVK